MKKNNLIAFMQFSMRLTVFQIILFWIGNFSLFASEGRAQEILKRRVTLQVSQRPISDVIDIVHKKTGVHFLYSTDAIRAGRLISCNLVRKTVGDVLEEVFQPLGIGYRLVEEKILLYQLNPPEGAGWRGLVMERIEGVVVNEAGESLGGVSVTEKGTRNGTITGDDGRFSLTVSNSRPVLVFSAVGYSLRELAVGNQLILRIVLSLADERMDSIVVTAFGIKRNQKALGYASQKVDGEQLAAAGNTNLQNALQGKAAGVQVRLSSGMPGRPALINIRGSRSITGSNEPLYVIDGLPVAAGNRAIDFNPEDIESMDILKGAAAAALYGVRASNGVIVITTKSGKNATKKPTVTVESQFTNDRVSFLPQMQYDYAQGNNGIFDQNGLFAFGPLISSLAPYINQQGEQEQPASYHNMDGFYHNGSTWNNNVELAQGGGFGNYAIGIGRTDQSGVIPSTGLKRTNIKFNGMMNPFANFKAGISINYADIDVDDFADLAGNDNLFRTVYETPPSYNLKGKPYAETNDPYKQILFRAVQNNPYWILAHNFQNTRTKRTFGNLFLEWQVTSDLKFSYRVGLDNYETTLERYDELGTGPVGRTTIPSGGKFILENQQETQVNSNFIASYDKKLSSAFVLNVVAGTELFDIRRKTATITSSNLSTGNWPNIANGTTVSGSNNNTSQRVVGFYGNANIGYKELLFLNLSARQDFASNLPSSNRSFLYPSAGLSFILTQAVPSLKNIFSFAKLRANYAEVGQLGPLFVNGVGYSRANPGFQFPYNGVAGFLPSATSISTTLRPENTRSVELGTELRFWNNRLSVDYTYFHSLSDGQIFGIPLPPSTGYGSQVSNAGKMLSRGHEIMLHIIPVKTSIFSWEFNTNFSSYTSRVNELPDGLDRIVLADANGQVQLVAEKGKAYASFYGRAYQRDPASGDIVVSSVSGIPLQSPSLQILGSPNPDFEFNFINALRYKSFKFSFQLDWRKGGLFYSMLQAETRSRGLSAVTLDRDIKQIVPGKKGDFVNGQLVVKGDNDVAINKTNPYWAALFAIPEAQLDDASFMRMREVSLSYELPVSWIKKWRMGSASVFLSGRNLFLITKTFVDPELNMTNTFSGASTANSVGIEWYQQPQTRSIGGGIRVQF